MKSFALLEDVDPIHRSGEHGGTGPIVFRRMLAAGGFATNIDFLDVTTVPSGSTIGKHYHSGNDEVYFIASGSPLVRVDGDEKRLSKGAIAIVQSDGWHELVNDTPDPVEIFVVQVRR
ncbi:MAG TPA: cupin domain-containing protein [Candidatus Eremiobacteraceae bacterium]|nr:cupin domain-containing protein [Candidatus Eremiobacteraceae bacterium]